jgi:hypothetical protein
VKEAHQAKETS